MCTAIMGATVLLLFLIRKLFFRAQTRSDEPAKCPFRFSSVAVNGRKESKSSATGLGWKERFIDGSPALEAHFIRQAMRDINEVQANNKKSAQAKGFSRAFHAKIQAGINNARLVISQTLPQELPSGFFQAGKSYATSLRFSNAAGTVKPDTAKDLRGIALKVETEHGIQDFLATNGSASHARDARQFILFAKAMSGAKLLILPRLICTIGLFETLRMFKTVIRQTKRPIDSLATETYYSRSPFACGDCAFKFQISPSSSAAVSVNKGDSFLRQDLVERLKAGPVVFDLQVQFFSSEASTPVEDGSVEWDSPLITVAQLVIPQQDLENEEAVAAHKAVEDLEFNPWNCADGIRPLGSLNRARRLVYQASVALRKGL